MADEPDFSHLPAGQLGWRSLVEALAAMPDKTERHFLEFKGSETNLMTKDHQAKVARFVLGAANRDPSIAASRFDGCALMVIGIDENKLVGVPFFEPMDLQNYLLRVTGTPGPVWDFDLINVSSTNSIVVIKAAPPDAASQPWICRVDGPALQDGMHLIRGEGTSRIAKSAEIDAMRQRSAVAKTPQVKLKVEILGMARAYDYEPQIVDAYLADAREKLMDALPKPKPKKEATRPPAELASAALLSSGLIISEVMANIVASNRSVIDSTNMYGAGTLQENRTKDQYIAEIDAWEQQVRNELPKLLDKTAACIWPGVRVKITNTTDTYLDEPEVHIHIRGKVEGLGWERRDEIPRLLHELPSPPRTWGPRSQVSSLLGANYGQLGAIAVPRFPTVAPQRHRIVRFTNGGSVNLRFSLEDIRPRGSWTSDHDDLVLIMREEDVTELDGTWMATIKGRDVVYEGTVTVEVSEDVNDFSKWLDAELNGRDESD